MRIGFDLRPALRKNSRRRGIGKFSLQFCRHLLQENRRHQYVIYVQDRQRPQLEGCESFREVPALRKPSRLNWIPDLVSMPRLINRDRLDLFHATEITALPLHSRSRVWATVHDLIPFIFWQEISRTLPWDYALALKTAFKRMKKVDRILTDSACSRSDICRRLGFPEDRVHVIYLDVDPLFAPGDPAEAQAGLAEHYRIREPFLFYVGGSDFRKNLPTLIEAFAAIRKRGYSGKLVLGGETFGWGIPEVVEIRRKVTAFSLEQEVVFPGYIPDADLPLFYRACDLFVFPSLYEGFGLPVLEAMRCGTPVLCSNRSSLPEVAGDAAAYFDPQDADSLADTFERVWGNPNAREDMSALGLRQAQRFSWKRAAEEVHRLYELHGE